MIMDRIVSILVSCRFVKEVRLVLWDVLVCLIVR